MIFGAKNEDGISTCDLVLQKKKTVTRRLMSGRIYEEDRDYAVQPSRTSKSVGRIKIISSVPHNDWMDDKINHLSKEEQKRALNIEAKKEGFNSWSSLVKYFIDNKIEPYRIIRYEFELLNEV